MLIIFHHLSSHKEQTTDTTMFEFDFKQLVAEFMALYELPDTTTKQLKSIVGTYARYLRWSNDGFEGGSVMLPNVYEFHRIELEMLNKMCRSHKTN